MKQLLPVQRYRGVNRLFQVLDNFGIHYTYESIEYILSLWDTGPEYCDRLRPLSYTGNGVILICYSLIDGDGCSFLNVKSKVRNTPNTPYNVKFPLGEDTNGSGNRLVTSGNKPGIEPILLKFHDAV